jgi:hypothetical protein
VSFVTVTSKRFGLSRRVQDYDLWRSGQVSREDRARCALLAAILRSVALGTGDLVKEETNGEPLKIKAMVGQV